MPYFVVTAPAPAATTAQGTKRPAEDPPDDPNLVGESGPEVLTAKAMKSVDEMQRK